MSRQVYDRSYLSSARALCGNVAAALALSLLLSNLASAQTGACDLDLSGGTNVVDVNRAVSMALGTLPCTASVEGPNLCTIVTVQRVVNAALGQPCVTYNSGTQTVTVSWIPSTSVGAVGSNVYRATTPTGAFTKLNSAVATATSFTDTNVQLGQTYYYVLTAVDASGNESGYSSPVSAVIPTA